MRLCDICGNQFAAEEISCPYCKTVMGGFLGKSITGYPDMRKVAVDTVKELEGRWAFNPFAPGWRVVDILGRVILIMVLIMVAFGMNRSLKEQGAAAVNQLETHRTRARDAELHTNREIKALGQDYSTMVSNASELISALKFNGEIQVVVLMALIALLATSAVASYRQWKDLHKVRATLRFLCTNEGRAFVGEILVHIASEQFMAMQDKVKPLSDPDPAPSPEEKPAEEKPAEEKPAGEEPPGEKPPGEKPEAEAGDSPTS